MSEQISRKAKSSRFKKLLNIFTLAGMVFLIYASRHQIIQTLENLQSIKAWILWFMILWQLINYHAYTELYRDLFKILGHKKIEYKKMYKASVELNFVNHVFPSAGVVGFSYFSWRMKDFGIATSKATLVQMMRFVFIFASFQVIILAGVVILALDGKANNFTILVASSLGTAMAIGSIAIVYIAGSKSRINSFTVGLTKVLNRIIQFVRPKHPETINISSVQKLFFDLHDDYLILKKNYKSLKKPFFYAMVANLTELATVYTVYVAFGHLVNPGAVILAYAVANFAGLIAVLPGGIGIYEALMAAILTASGVPLSLAVSSTVMYRILSMAIQLPPGYYLYNKVINRGAK
jgi:uncharacterized protein (TIRG00374 family)